MKIRLPSAREVSLSDIHPEVKKMVPVYQKRHAALHKEAKKLQDRISHVSSTLDIILNKMTGDADVKVLEEVEDTYIKGEEYIKKLLAVAEPILPKVY